MLDLCRQVSMQENPQLDKAAEAGEAPTESAVNRELRRLNRWFHGLRARDQALAQAGSEQKLLREICDIIVRVGGYRMAGIAYAEQDEEKTVRPMAHATGTILL